MSSVPPNKKNPQQIAWLQQIQSIGSAKIKGSVAAYLTSVNQALGKLMQVGEKQLHDFVQKSSGAVRSSVFSNVAQVQQPSPKLDANPPATIQTLDIDGVTVIEYEGMAFPVGHVLPMGQPGDISNYTPSEAFGYAMRNAVEYNDEEFFDELLNGYLYLVNQTTLYRENQMGMSGDQLGEGLIGWSPDIVGIPDGQGPYSGLDTQFVSSASDADEDVISAMILGYHKWGDVTVTDPISTGANTYSSISLKDLIDTAIQSFVNCDLGTFSLTLNGNTTTYYALTNDNWGHNALYPDYFDPVAFALMIKWVGADSSEGQALEKAAQGTMQMITDVANANGGWIPDSPYYMQGPSTFGYDAVRILMRFGEYLLVCSASGKDPLGIEPSVESVLNTLVSNIFSDSYLSWNNGTVTFTPSGLTLAQFTGPLLVALIGLQAVGDLPDDVTQTDITNVEGCLQHDLTVYNDDSMQDWQQSYFAIELGLLCQGILNNYEKYEKSHG